MEHLETKGVAKFKFRSPAYPAYSLPKALEQARKFYDEQRHHPAPVMAAISIWGFGAKSSGGLQTVSALKQFSLMSESGESESRLVQLTSLALSIVSDQREVSTDRDEAIKQSALEPKIYAEMWNKWGRQLPSDATIKFFLERDKKYNPDAISDLIRDYKDTLAFAKMGESDKLPPKEEGDSNADLDKAGRQSQMLPSAHSPTASGVKLMEGERIVFTHEIEPSHGVRILASGEVDESLLDALEVFVELQKKRLGRQKPSSQSVNGPLGSE